MILNKAPEEIKEIILMPTFLVRTVKMENMVLLLNDNQIEDLKKAVKNETYREKLYKEYGL